jgi:hypothetical protein
VDCLLHLRVHPDHVLIQLRVLAHHDFGIPRGCDKDGLDTTLQRRGEAVGHLQANEEGVCHHDGSEFAIAVVCWVGEDKVKVGEAGEKGLVLSLGMRDGFVGGGE